jgi:UDP-glucose 4-epimerase
MKVLVTGGAGFIGSHLTDALLAAGHETLVVDNLATGQRENVAADARFFQMDVRDPALSDLLQQERPEVVFHQAAQTTVRLSTADPFYDADVNVRGLLNLLTASVWAGVRKVVFASSGGTVYGTCDQLPITEDQPLHPESPYGITKTAGEDYLRYFAANFGLHYTALRYANVYGPRDHVSSEHVITVFAETLLAGDVPTIHWDGEQAKDYVYVDDVVRANLLALGQGDDQAYNIGSGQAVSVNTLYALITRLLGRQQVVPKQGPKRLGDVRLFYLDCRKAQRELGWQPQVSLEEGLIHTLAWYRSRKYRVTSPAPWPSSGWPGVAPLSCPEARSAMPGPTSSSRMEEKMSLPSPSDRKRGRRRRHHRPWYKRLWRAVFPASQPTRHPVVIGVIVILLSIVALAVALIAGSSYFSEYFSKFLYRFIFR